MLQDAEKKELNTEEESPILQEELSSEKANEISEQAALLVVRDASRYAENFSENKFISKIKSVAKAAGIVVIYPALLLFEIFKSKTVPVEKKALVVGALGYFILPLDLIPDFIVGFGYVDDAAALMACLRTLMGCVTPEVTKAARERLHTWFREVDEKLLDSIDQAIKTGESIMKNIQK